MPDEPADPLADHPVKITLPVLWGDQDAYAHVNNTVYFRWYESARLAYCEALGLVTAAASGGLGPILAAIQCDFLRPVNYPDTIRVGGRITRMGRSSLTMDHAVWSEAQGLIVAKGTSVLVVYDYAQKQPCPIPPELRAAIERLEGKTF
jgi:acyl-CoA thioester hydrolase